MPRIIVTGSRDWTCEEQGLVQIEDELAKNMRGMDWSAVNTIVQGGSGNVDAAANNWALARGYQSETHWAKWDELGKKAGPIRNQEMVDAGADLCVAFWDGKSRGTLDCIKRAVVAGIPVQIIPAADGGVGEPD